MKLNDVHFSFDHRGIAGLHGIHIALEHGELFTLLGPNGAGKTTLLRMLAGQLKPTKGEVLQAKSVAWVEAIPRLPATQTVKQYLMEQASSIADQEQAEQLARDMADMFNFTFQLRQKCSELSSGESQRVALSAALVSGAELILLDEPFGHWDREARKEAIAQVREYLKNREQTAVLVTHHIEDALLFSHRVGVLQNGSWAQIGTPHELITMPASPMVATLLGYHNLVTATHKDELLWSTPLGDFTLPNFPQKTKLVAIFPRSCFILASHGITLTVQSIHMTMEGLLVSAELQGTAYQLVLPYHSAKEIQVNAKITLQVDPKQLLWIDCLVAH